MEFLYTFLTCFCNITFVIYMTLFNFASFYGYMILSDYHFSRREG